MTDTPSLDPAAQLQSPTGAVLQFPDRRAPQRVTFDRSELRAIFNVYGRKVADGEWRDYAIDFESDRAVFSIYRRTSEMPLYRVEKIPALRNKQGAYSVVTVTGLILKRGADLDRVLRVLEKPVKLVRS